jgi:hypothetical protein
LRREPSRTCRLPPPPIGHLRRLGCLTDSALSGRRKAKKVIDGCFSLASEWHRADWMAVGERCRAVAAGRACPARGPAAGEWAPSGQASRPRFILVVAPCREAASSGGFELPLHDVSPRLSDRRGRAGDRAQPLVVNLGRRVRSEAAVSLDRRQPSGTPGSPLWIFAICGLLFSERGRIWPYVLLQGAKVPRGPEWG